MGMKWIWRDGDWREDDGFAVSAGDRGLLHGLGLFETLLALDGKPVFVGRHLARLASSCGRLGWPLDVAGLEGVMRELLSRNGLTSGRAKIRLSLSAGRGRLDDVASGVDRVMWMSAAAVAPVEEGGIAMDLCPWVRNEDSPVAGMKMFAYAENLVALDSARRRGFGETLFLNRRGWVCETAMANVFWVRDGHLMTPSLGTGCLPGVTRGVLVELAARCGLACREVEAPPHELETADEVFLTSSIMGVRAVSRFGSKEFGAGRITRLLAEALDQERRAQHPGSGLP